MILSTMRLFVSLEENRSTHESVYRKFMTISIAESIIGWINWFHDDNDGT